jgi:hypothetical protein
MNVVNYKVNFLFLRKQESSQQLFDFLSYKTETLIHKITST